VADKNLLIGIGGTGSKIVEAFIHLCAAGLGPAQAEIGFIEQDSSNGNLGRATRTLSCYLALHHLLRGVNSPDHIRKDSEFCPTTLKPLGVPSGGLADITGCVWTPSAAATPSILFGTPGMAAGPRALFNSLCDKAEANLDLGYGFQGRAHVGAMAMRDAATGKFWDDIAEVIKGGEGVGTLQIFLAGSIFGGTGAAGFPTLARHIRNLIGDRHGIEVSGMLMLPYFSFGPSADPESAAVQSSELAEQTKISLEYYARLLEEQTGRPIFRDLYVLGWDPLFHLAYNEIGKQNQCNPPLVPELFAALAAANVFRGQVQSQAAGAKNGGAAKAAGNSWRVLGCARADVAQFKWADLTAVGDSPATVAQQAIKRWLRFCFAWKYIYRAALNKNERVKPKEQWFKLFGDTIAFEAADYDSAVAAIDNYVDEALLWSAGLGFASKPSFELWKALPYAVYQQSTGFPKALLKTCAEVVPGSLDEVIVADQPGVSVGTARELFECMSSPMATGDSHGLGKLVDAVFEASAAQAA